MDEKRLKSRALGSERFETESREEVRADLQAASPPNQLEPGFDTKPGVSHNEVEDDSFLPPFWELHTFLWATT